MNEPVTPPAPPSNAAPSPAREVIKLQHPIQREGGAIPTLELRKPKAGELRGLNIQSLMVGDVNTVITLLPRIAMPIITAHEAAQLEAEDLSEVAGAIMLFFMSSGNKAVVQDMMGGSPSTP